MTPPAERTDRELADEVRQRKSEEAFRELYRRHSPALWRFVRLAAAGSHGEVDDIHQEVWIRALSGLAAFRWISSFRTWLIGIAINRCRESVRSKKRNPAEPDRDPTESDFSSTEIAPAIRLDLERAIAELSPGYRQVLVLHDIEGYTHEEIGALLSIDSGTSKSQLSRARRAVRERWNRAAEPTGESS